MYLASLLDWWKSQWASIPTLSGWMFGIALLISSAGFYRRVYFVSIGYAFSITAMAVFCMIWLFSSTTWLALVHACFLALYGVRLGGYLLHREFATAYTQEREAEYQQKRQSQRGIDLLIWFSVSLLYVFMFMPGLLHMLTSSMFGTAAWWAFQGVGGFVMFLGLGLEALADKQKSDFKKLQPKRFCDVGLYRFVRCPNYLGEILVWVGSFVWGVPFYTSGLRWFVCLVGLVCIVLIMMGSTKRLERSQGERYGSDPAYQNYVQSVPVLFPFVPIYSLQGVKVYLE